MNLIIATEPTLGFYRDGAPPAAAIVYRRLNSVGAIRRPLGPDASIASTSVELENGDGALTDFFSDPPLRTSATINSGALSFGGLIASVQLGAVIRLDIEAGGFWSLADKVPLRNTTAWGSYKNVQTIPHGYGRLTLTPIQYDKDGRVFVLLDHAIQGVDEVTRDDVPTAAYKFRNGLDTTGRAVAFLELAEPLADGERLAVTLRGKPHAVSGALLVHPAEVVHDFLANVCGFALALSDFDDLRAQTAHLEIHGLVNDAAHTIRAQVDEMMRSIGAVWSTAMPGFGRLWPWPDDANEPSRATIGPAATLTAVADHGAIYTVLRVLYDYDHAAARHRRALQVEAPDAIKLYGRIERELDARWLRSPPDAQALATRDLADNARPRWRMTADDDLDDVPPGTIVTLNHPRAPLSGRMLVFDAAADPSANRMSLALDAPAGAAPAIVLATLSSAFEPVIVAGAFATYSDGKATFKLIGDRGEPLRFARVTLDGLTTRTADNGGVVQFVTARGKHLLYVEAPGYAPIEIEREL